MQTVSLAEVCEARQGRRPGAADKGAPIDQLGGHREPAPGAERPGRWVAEPSWPSPGIVERVLHLNDGGRLDTAGATPGSAAIRTPMTMGTRQGEWCGYGLVPDSPADQREDDGCSVVFETAPLAEPLEIMGAPVLELEVSADRPNAFIVARLSSVAPDGAATRVTYGVLNLTHRESHENPEPLEPGRSYRVRIQLNDIAQQFPAGHKIRVALSNSLWPLFWPSPEPVTVTLATGTGTLTLPTRAPRGDDAGLRPFGPPESSPPLAATTLEPSGYTRRVERDDVTGEVCVIVESGGGMTRFDELDDWQVGSKVVQRFTVRDDDPNSARIDIHVTWRFRRPDAGFDIRSETRSTLTSTKNDWVFWADCEAYENGRRVWARTWDERIPRDLN